MFSINSSSFCEMIFLHYYLSPFLVWLFRFLEFFSSFIGAFGVLVGHPLDTIKVRLQLEPSNFKLSNIYDRDQRVSQLLFSFFNFFWLFFWVFEFGFFLFLGESKMTSKRRILWKEVLKWNSFLLIFFTKTRRWKVASLK